MKSFLGLPIMLRGVAYGNLYLTEKEGGQDFTDEDSELSQLLAAQAAVAIENARLYESSTRWLRQFESLNEIGNALSSELELEPLLGLVARRLHELVDAKLVMIALPDGDLLRWPPPRRKRLRGGRLARLAGSKAGRVLERGRRAHRFAAGRSGGRPAGDPSPGVHSALYVPLIVRGRPIGIVIAHDKRAPLPSSARTTCA
jgi:GAF domain-containing protein